MMFFSKFVVVLFTLTWVFDVSAHYCFVSIDRTTAWDVVRRTDNHWSGDPITNVNDPNFRCYNSAGGAATNTYSVEAGHKITFNANSLLYHAGSVNVYMAKAPGKAKDFDGAGKVWFRIFEITPHADPAGKNELTNAEHHFHDTKERSVRTVSTAHRIISSEAAYPRYLLRIENIALHGAHQLGGAQFYLACAQIEVKNGGSGSPGPLVSIPGVYTGNEPGIFFNVYWPIPTSYIQPGPAIWRG